MQPFERFPAALFRQIRFVLSDVDDTLTDGPRLPGAAYLAIERLQPKGAGGAGFVEMADGLCAALRR